jgi:hypothetical protein
VYDVEVSLIKPELEIQCENNDIVSMQYQYKKTIIPEYP